MPLQTASPRSANSRHPARGTLMGNRGGRLHDDERKLGARRWTADNGSAASSHSMIRHREVWGDGYTELFFLDEVTAFAAGHRPCFECRRKDAEHFADAVLQANHPRATARANGRRFSTPSGSTGKAKRLHRRAIDELPDGAMIARRRRGLRRARHSLLRWTPSGYRRQKPRPRRRVDVLTPPAMLAVLARAATAPLWHDSAR